MSQARHQRLKFLVLITIAFLAILCIAPLVFGENITKVDLTRAFQAPNAQEWFGTDALGRSVFQRTLSGGIQTVLPAILILMIVVTIGSFIGISSGLLGGRIDKAILLLITAFQAFPSIIFVIMLVGILGVGLEQTILAICITTWAKYAYLTRSMTLQLKKEPYIQSAVMYGNGFFQTMTHYYLPSLFPQILTTMMFDVSTVIMEIAGLSFIGLGAQVPSPEWGAMINDGRTYIQEAPWIVFFPCLMIILTVLLFARLGEILKQTV
ncbi:ABC transporter permease [Streptococcus himalayensis]|uniref:Peptide ABC transporter permease n=1 Tax=Streptococcus himalayensis TaxID=1888195 RepID=A0A917EGX3_9STRE|nr:ABC transporter permease [Streptococcus himalayensis]GGE34744.1 peptide ABC transporter permease [Streptococcus himalayensis]